MSKPIDWTEAQEPEPERPAEPLVLTMGLPADIEIMLADPTRPRMVDRASTAHPLVKYILGRSNVRAEAGRAMEECDRLLEALKRASGDEVEDVGRRVRDHLKPTQITSARAKADAWWDQQSAKVRALGVAYYAAQKRSSEFWEPGNGRLDKIRWMIIHELDDEYFAVKYTRNAEAASASDLAWWAERVPADGPGTTRADFMARTRKSEKWCRDVLTAGVRDGVLRVEERDTERGGTPVKVYWSTADDEGQG